VCRFLDKTFRLTQPFVSSIYSVKYSGVAYSGTQNNVAYMTSDLNFWTLEFSLFDMLQVPLCDATMTNTSDCPGDGEYDYSVDYKLPNSGSESASWLASGWEGTGFIRMYAEPDESMMIGECLLTLQTFVTPDPSRKWYQVTPSAAVLSGMILGVGSVLFLGCFYCYCCCRRRSETKKTRDKISPEDSLEATFKRMEDEQANMFKLMEDEKVTMSKPMEDEKVIAMEEDEKVTMFKRMDDEKVINISSSKSVGANVVPNRHRSSNKSVVSERGSGRVPMM
jgi:hypothetical protein